MSEIKLQVALDLLSTDQALSIAEQASLFDFIEAGTPLIKQCGLTVVSKLKERFPNHTIVADLKTMDTGALEANMAAKAGAGLATVLGAAPNEVINEFVNQCKEDNILSMVDLIGIEDKVGKINSLESKPDYILIHTGIDEQNAGKNPFDAAKEIRDQVQTKLAIAGGIKLETFQRALECKPDLIIIGGAVTKADNIKETCQKFIEMIR